MGLIADLKQFFRGEDGDAQVAYSKGDLGGEDIVTAQHFQGSGVDSGPRPGDYMVVVPGPEAGTFIAVGYIDPANPGVAREGDVRLYCRDGNGGVVGELHMANNGEPDWQATAGALIARADKVDDLFAEVVAALDAGLAAKVAQDGGAAAFTAASEYLDGVLELKSSAAEKGWVT